MIKAKILVVDNDENRLLNLKDLLNYKFDIIIAHNSKTALDILENDSIRIVIIDLSIVKKDGFELLKGKKNKRNLDNIPVLISVNKGEEFDEATSLELGVLDFIYKPFESKIITLKIENLISLEESIKTLSLTDKDPITGLNNRVAFYTNARKMLNQRLNTAYEILTIDVDKFSVYNELFHENEGNRLLEYIGLFLSSNLDLSQCVVGRIYADSFGILCPIKNNFPEQLIKNLNKKLKEFRDDYNVLVHMGVYPITNRSLEISVMVTRSFAALNLNKGKVSDCISFYNDQIRSVVHEELAITREMQSALDNGEFVPYFQPKNDLKTHNLVGAEALVRWIHPVKGLIPPSAFIPVFEKNGFISKLDEYIWDKVCAQIKIWKDKGLDVPPISVNLSRIDIYNPNLINIFQGLIEKYDIPKSSIELEITETSYTKNLTQLISVVKNLRIAGFRVEMDDFGKGYSSLNMLSEVPVDVLKIDLSFLKNIETNTKNIDIVYFIMDMAKWMKLDVVAEGVETLDQVNLLINLGCRVGQGYFFSKPLEIKVFEKQLTNNSYKINTPQKIDSQIKICDFWEIHNEFSHIINSFSMPYALYDYYNKEIHFVCSNNAYLNIYSYAFNDTPLNNAALNDSNLEHINLIIKMIEQKNSSLEPQSYDFKFQRTNYSSIWLRITVNFSREKKGHYLFSVSLQDITNIKIQEANMSDALMSLTRGLLESDIGFWEYNIATREPKFLKDYLRTENLNIYGKMYDFLKNYIFPSNAFKKLNEEAVRSKNFVSNYIHIKKNQKDNWAKINCHPCIDQDGQVRKVFGIMTNASFEKRAITIYQNEVNYKENLSKNVFLYITYDLEKNSIVSIDDKLSEVTNARTFKSYKQFFKTLYLDNAYEDDKMFFKPCLSKRELIKNFKIGKREYRIEYRTKNANIKKCKWVKLLVSIVQNPENGKLIFIGTSFDITEEKKKEMSIKLKAFHDAMTQTLNREAFRKNVETSIKRMKANNEKGAFLIFDIDNFKEINDKYGHVEGDKAIKVFANVLKKSFRNGDILGRLGGDEFIVFIENCVNQETLAHKYEVIKEELLNSSITNKLQQEMSCSLGVSFYPESGTKIEELYSKADRALYDAKRCGKNKISFYSSLEVKTK